MLEQTIETGIENLEAMVNAVPLRWWVVIVMALYLAAAFPWFVKYIKELKHIWAEE